MESFRDIACRAALLTVVAVVPAAAQSSRPRPAPPPAAPAAAPAQAATAVPSIPQQTTASFADWTLRCVQSTPDTRSCELIQGIQRDDKPVAQIALGRPAKGQPVQLALLVPPSVSLMSGAALVPAREGDGPALDLAWRRCLPIGCIAEVAPGEDALRRLRGMTEAARITFVDGAGRASAVPFSPRGLSQALDALAKEEAS